MLGTWLGGWKLGKGPTDRRPERFRPQLERLEERAVPALNVTDLGTQAPSVLVNTLLGTGVQASNISYTGVGESSGTFTGGNGIIGFDSGIILSTGHADAVVGPNTADDTSFDNGLPGDSQLSDLIGGTTTNDATELSFDFVPAGNTLTFNYVFGSEEYNEFVGQGFSDVFAFFVNGQNVALVPGSTQSVNIDSINLTTNSQYYINNALSTGSDPNPTSNPINTELDGITTVLQISVKVNPGVTNNIKLAIADATDSIYDSDVFIQAGSFSSTNTSGNGGSSSSLIAAEAAGSGLRAFHPFRYSFVTPQSTYFGNVTVLNTSSKTISGPITLEFPDLPANVKLLNADGIDPNNNNAPFITVNIGSLPLDQALRIPIKLSNPTRTPLSTFFEGFTIEAFQGTVT